ncbi:MAG: hypothetical protein ACQEWM_05655 [Actinomycetota bacterium]
MNASTQLGSTFFVFGLPWWPFDGAVTAALIAGIFAIATGWWSYRRLIASEARQLEAQRELQDTAQVFQRGLHEEIIIATSKTSEREQLLIDLRRAEDALAQADPAGWVFAAVICKNAKKHPEATLAERRRANAALTELLKRNSV